MSFSASMRGVSSWISRCMELAAWRITESTWLSRSSADRLASADGASELFWVSWGSIQKSCSAKLKWWNQCVESCNFRFLNTSDFCRLQSVQPLWNLAMKEPWAVFSFPTLLTLQCEFIILPPKKSINFTTFKHFLLRPRPNRRRRESTWPSRPWPRSSRWSGWRYQEPKSPARHWTPGTAGHRWTQMKTGKHRQHRTFL